MLTNNKIYINFFTERGYNLQKLQNVPDEIAKVNREYLFYKPKTNDQESGIPKSLPTQWDPQLSKLFFILSKHKSEITNSGPLVNSFLESLKTMYQRKRNLKDMLCKSDIP